jgi:hypothetical protein
VRFRARNDGIAIGGSRKLEDQLWESVLERLMGLDSAERGTERRVLNGEGEDGNDMMGLPRRSRHIDEGVQRAQGESGRRFVRNLRGEIHATPQAELPMSCRYHGWSDRDGVSSGWFA